MGIPFAYTSREENGRPRYGLPFSICYIPWFVKLMRGDSNVCYRRPISYGLTGRDIALDLVPSVFRDPIIDGRGHGQRIRLPAFFRNGIGDIAISFSLDYFDQNRFSSKAVGCVRENPSGFQ
jgi:hypothetical protein